MNTTWNLERYLDKMTGKEIRVFIVNGFQMTGILESFDDVSFQIRDQMERKEKLIFFSGITTIEEA